MKAVAGKAPQPLGHKPWPAVAGFGQENYRVSFGGRRGLLFSVVGNLAFVFFSLVANLASAKTG